MHAAFHEYLGPTGAGLLAFALGLILASISVTRGDRAMAVSWMLASVAVVLAPHFAGQVDRHHISWAERLFPLPMMGIYLATPAYIRHLVMTAKATAAARRLILRANALGAAIGVVTFGIAVVEPARFLNGFVLVLDDADPLRTSDFWLFGTGFVASGIALGTAWMLLSHLELDAGERIRAEVYAIAIPPLMASLVLALPAALFAFSAAVALSLYGVLRHLTVQGERAAFLSRFLSPQVAELVRLRGLNAVMQPQQLVVSVVCMDFRGFTSYTEAIPSQAVIDLISDYHEAVADAVASHDGMIKDYAGDGILILVGAPIPPEDHALAAVALAQDAMRAAHEVTERWATGPHPLGVGIGIATGRVTVGAIGDTARMDYTVVGTAVNLAARLCGAAEDGAILVDSATAAAVPTATSPRGELQLKGLSDPVPIFDCVGAG